MNKAKKNQPKIFKAIVFLTISIFLLSIFYFSFFSTLKSKIQIAKKNSTTNSQSQVKGLKNNQPQITNSYQVPILMYHYIRDWNQPEDKTGIKLSVSPINFDKQIKWLKDNNYQTVNLDYLIKPYAISDKPVILTFDDGYRDAYTNAYPILKKYGFIGTFYIITDVANDPAYMTWDMIKEMKNNGMNFGSHTATHPDLSKATNSQIDYQLTTSTNTLKTELGKDITDFCYPSGKYNDYVIAKLKELGYKTATTTHTGISDQNSNLFELPRLRIENDANLKTKLEQK